MKLMMILCSLAVAAVGNVLAQSPLKIGDKAPQFSGKDQDGKSVSLKGYKGNKIVLIQKIRLPAARLKPVISGTTWIG
jgi:thioredoxin-dependent peroxiredoxin